MTQFQCHRRRCDDVTAAHAHLIHVALALAEQPRGLRTSRSKRHLWRPDPFCLESVCRRPHDSRMTTFVGQRNRRAQLGARNARWLTVYTYVQVLAPQGQRIVCTKPMLRASIRPGRPCLGVRSGWPCHRELHRLQFLNLRSWNLCVYLRTCGPSYRLSRDVAPPSRT